ncbi:MAG: hypothetical protein ACM3MK_08610 [Chitinophagales bacterium]
MANKFLKEVFYIDGSLRDIYIKNTTIDDWQKALNLLCAKANKLEFYQDGVLMIDNKYKALDIFKIREQEIAVLMVIRIGSVNIHCHFFDEQEIEFDIDPKEVIEWSQFELIISFIRELAEVLGKEVILTPENMPEIPLLLAKPGNIDVVFLKH